MPDDRPAGADEARPTADLPLAKRIIGYCDPLSVTPGQEVRVFVSCDPAITSYQAELVRFRATAGGAAADAPDWQPVPGCAGRYPARHQEVHPGSYAVIPDAGPILAGGEITLALLVQPTYRAPATQVLAACGDPWAGHGFALALDSELRPVLVGGLAPDEPVTCPALLQPGTWSLVLATFGGDAPSRVTAGPLAGTPASWSHAGGSPVTLPPSPLTNGPADSAQESDLILGAVRSPAGPTRLHFTGRLESPVILAGQLGPDEARALLAAGPASLDDGRVRAAWDFSAGIDGWNVTDLGPHARHGTLHNLPMRAVRGARWTGEHDDWRQAPEQYAALHFLADALEDCGWEADATWTVPAGTPSGFYAVQVSSGPDRDFLPLFVRPPWPGDAPPPGEAPASAATPAAKVLLIAPTATYASYGNSRFWWENPIQEMVQDRLVEIGAEEQYLIAHPELGSSSYDCHLDGTDICYVSRRRPNLNMRPGHVRREGYTSDLDLVAWLDQLDVGYDVVTDEDLHRAGPALLQRYQVALTGTHPEYMSARMFDAIALWTTTGGGRLMYLGGNGFSMNVNFDAERPWIMENRRVELWERGEEFQRSEAFNSTDGRRGGYFSASGREPAAVTGVESATMGFDHSYPYVLGEAARRPEAAFVFEGVAGPVIGDFGAIGGGVVGQEWDNAAGHQFGPEHLILGSSHDHTLVPPLFGAVRPDYHADLVLYLRGSGAVFSVSSMAWCAALSHDNYANEIARITHNVLGRFLDPAPFATSGDD
jgi:N,N-dimethylformamidase